VRRGGWTTPSGARTPTAILYPLSSILILFVVSCASPTGPGRAPQANKQPPVVSSIDFYGTELKFAWEFANPTSREIRVLNYVWELHVGGKRVQRAQSKQHRRIAPGATTELEFPVTVKRAALEKLLRTTSLPSEMPYRFIGRVYLGAGVSAWDFYLEDAGDLKLLAGPRFDIQKFHVERMDTLRADLAIEIRIQNPNTFPTKLDNLTADFILAGQTIAQGVKAPAREIAPSGETVVPLSLDVNFTSLGKVVYHALNQSETTYTLYGQTDVSTPWGVKKMNYDQSGQVKIEREKNTE